MGNPGISLTICIPVFNQDVRDLVRSLKGQMTNPSMPCSILVVDDGSDAPWRQLNAELGCSQVTYIEMGQNMGRAAIRNHLADRANTTHLLFLDGDVTIPQTDYLAVMLQYVNAHPQTVILGGLTFPTHALSTHRLQQMYGRKVISKQHLKKNAAGQISFISCNFIIERQVFQNIQFDTRIKGYGHEDTVFGYELHHRNIPVAGWHNPVLKGQLDTNEVYLDKVRQGVGNLRQLATSPKYERAVAGVRLVKAAKKMGATALGPLFNVVMKGCEPLVVRHLLSGRPMLPILNGYKLYLFTKGG